MAIPGKNYADSPAPLLEMLGDAALEGAGAMIGKTVEMVQQAPGKLAQVAATTTAKVSAHVDNFSHKPSDTPETIKDVKARERELAVEAPALPEIAKSAAMSVQRAEAITKDVQDVSLDQAMGKQVVAASIERQQQQIGIG